MVFADLLFIYLFLPTVLGFYYLLQAQARNIILVAASIIFYTWGEPVWVILLIFSATVDFHCGKFIASRDDARGRRLGLVISLVSNLSLLAAFKYSGFLVTNINALTGARLPVPHFSLPIGISFYTFQTISYTVDIYRGRASVQKSFLQFLLFVSLFSQLIAGPIVRYTDIARELASRVLRFSDIAHGLRRFIMGLFKKVAIANSAGHLASVWMNRSVESQTVAGAWFGALMFTLQIYYDFSGYSDMAIGLGLMFGFHLPENFNYPYIARSVGDFWRRWHMSLSSFFRDYLYIPLGGKHRHMYLNLLIVWFLTGLWHGASWNFVLWGLYYLVFLVLEKSLPGRLLRRLPSALGHLYLIVVVIIGWVLFYFTDLSEGLEHLRMMLFMEDLPWFDLQIKISLANNLYWILASLLFCAPLVIWFKKMLQMVELRLGSGAGNLVMISASLAGLVISTVLLVGQTHNPFLYYRF
ncbi:MAG: membrane-bound O-acyltransferase family protein [Deltaproteobacteria bacterium HGW-Deltaproteobacteria-22]|nr:MAG: membrane-bound O-acyltransferase family protein [Deltaproteobacteria bacterium HGW-Deltaproteobacteria-22]